MMKYIRGRKIIQPMNKLLITLVITKIEFVLGIRNNYKCQHLEEHGFV